MRRFVNGKVIIRSAEQLISILSILEDAGCRWASGNRAKSWVPSLDIKYLYIERGVITYNGNRRCHNEESTKTFWLKDLPLIEL